MKWFLAWIAVVVALASFAVMKGKRPKPITKIRASSFDDGAGIAKALMKRLHFEIAAAESISVQTFSNRPWMRPVFETLVRDLKKTVSLEPYQERNRDRELKLVLVDLLEVGEQPSNCKGRTGKPLVLCLSNSFVWRLQAKKNKIKTQQYVAQVEQFQSLGFALYVRDPQSGWQAAKKTEVGD